MNENLIVQQSTQSVQKNKNTKTKRLVSIVVLRWKMSKSTWNKNIEDNEERGHKKYK